MANNNKQSILIGIKIDDINKVKTDLQKQLETVKGVNLKIDSALIDTAKFKSSIQTQLNNLNFTIKIGNVNTNGIDTVINSTRQATRSLEEMEAKFESVKTKMQGKLNTASALGIDTNLINQLQTQLNSLNVNTPTSQINQLRTQINGLGNNGASNINKLQGAINSLSTRINNIKATKMDIINSNDIGELQKAEAHLLNLKQLLTQVKAGKIIDGKLISSEVSTARNSVNQLSSAINNVKANASSLGTIFKSVFSYAIGGGVIFAGLNQLRQGLKDIKNIDDSLRDLKRVSGDVADTTLNNFVGKANEMGISLGRTTEDALTATATFKQLGYTFKEASEYMANNSLILSNVGDMSASDSASSLVSILKGFRLEAKDTTKVVDLLNESGNRFAITTKDLTEGLRIGGASLALANNDLAQSTALIVSGTEILRDSNMVSNGLKSISMRIRGVADESGEVVPKMREDLQALAGVDIKDVNGSFKSTYEIIKSLGERWNDKNNPLSDLVKANIAEQVAGKNRANVFASLMQNYQQLDKVYKMVGESAGSASREQESYINSISGKLNTFKETVKATWINVTDTNGIKSLITGASDVVGGLNNIIKTFGAMPTVIMSVVGAMTIFNTKFRESMTIYQPSFLTNLTGGLNNLKDTWAGVSKTATENIRTTKQNIIYMNQMGMNANSAKVQLAGYQGQLLLANIAQKACAVGAMALQMAFSMGLSLAISFVIGKVMELANAQENLKKSNEDVISSYNSTKESLASATQLLAEKKKVEEQLANTNDGTKENKDLKEKLLEVERQLAQALPNSVSGWDAQGKALATNNKLIQAQIDLKNKQLQQDSIKQLKDNTTMFDADIKSFKNMQQTLENYKKSREEVIAKNASAKASGNKLIEFSTQQAINDYNKEISVMETSVAQRRLLILQLVQTGKSYKEIADNIGETEDVVKSYTDAVSDNTQQQKQNSNQSEKVADKTKIVANAMKELNSGASISKESLQALQEAYPTMGINADNAKDSVQKLNDEISKNTADEHAKDIQDATDAYAKATQEIAKCNGFIDRLNKSQAMTPTLASAISKAYPEIGDNINKVTTAQEFLNQKIQDEVTQQASAYEVMMGDSEEFYQSKIANNNEYQSAYENLLSAFVGDGKKADDIDFENYRTLNELKQGTQHQFGQSIETWLISFVGESAKGYATDFENFRSTAEQKASVLNKLNQEIKKINSNLAGAEALKEGIAERHKYDFLGVSDPRVKSLDDNVLQQVDSNVEKWKAKASELNGAIQEVDTKFNEFGASMKGFSGGGLGGTSDFSGTGGSGKSKGESEAEKWADKINDLNSSIETDRYYDANNAITQLDNTMQALKTSEEGLTGSELADAKTKENEVINQQINAYKHLVDMLGVEKSELEQNLSQYGIVTDATGQLTNAQQKLAEEQAKANAMVGNSEDEFNAKKKAIEQVKTLSELVKRHGEIVNSEIPKATNTWNEYANSIEKSEKEALQKLKDDLADGIKKQTEDKKETELDKLDTKADKEKEKLQKEYDDEKERLEAEKKAEEDRYDKEIKKLQDKLNDLDNSKEDKLAKLKALEKEEADWNRDDSSYGKKQKNDLAEEIKNLKIDIQKDEINKQIDSLNEQKDNSNDYYTEEIKKTDDYYKDELDSTAKHYDTLKKRKEKKYKEMLTDKEIYAKADELITSDSQDEMLSILEGNSESYKLAGTILGENFTAGLLEELEKAKEALKDLTGDSSDSDSGSKSSSSKKSSKEVKVGDSVKVSNSSGEVIDRLENGTAMSSSGSLSSYSGEKLKTIDYDNGYFKVSNGDGTIGWVRRNDIAKFENGGRTPSNIPSSGATAILHKDEKILNAEDTVKFDEAMLKIGGMYDYIIKNGALISQLNSQYANPSNYSLPSSIGTNLNGIANNINTNTNNSVGDSNVEFNNNFIMNCTTPAQATNSQNDVINIMKKEFGSLKNTRISMQ